MGNSKGSRACQLLDKLFDIVWRGMAASGRCDEMGSAEYVRVFNSWIDAGRTLGIADFIYREANRTAEDNAN